ncbi:MAG: H-NS histone family protein [Candidatus Nitricoxidivorans perseverans]|uniref:H-NS histone family protein n=1 Tax=Candidatus Nitricoxidivorans perseverans TaxID=2975601 RepID=A0AA49FNG5_9PROT|nr:MAG: H-NS histone family protein [Candidatus Nitricoxidivorans perseverans]
MDLKSMAVGELKKLKAKIEKEIGNRENQHKNKAMGEIKAVVAKYGLKLDDIVGKAPAAKKPAAKKVPGKKAAAKSSKKILYRHPENSQLTWGGGRGRRPQWIKDWEAAGKTLDEVRVSQ